MNPRSGCAKLCCRVQLKRSNLGAVKAKIYENSSLADRRRKVIALLAKFFLTTRRIKSEKNRPRLVHPGGVNHTAVEQLSED